MSESRKTLEADHEPASIRKRLAEAKNHSYLGDGVLGAIDGGVTTFAIVSGVVGGGLTAGVVLILGFANLLADGFSMAASNYQATKSTRERADEMRRTEAEEIEQYPEGEREEVRQIYAAKGFEGEALEHAVDLITADKKLWIDTMMQEEHGLSLERPSPIKAGVVTFFAFLAAGIVPLVPFVVQPQADAASTFPYSIGFTVLTFLGIGVLKGKELNRPMLRSGLETLLIGGGAAAIAYVVGKLLREMVGV